MAKYRKKLRIIADILSIASKGAKKTQIMYRANLSYKLLRRYLTEVINADLVTFESGVDCYLLTRKGREFLKHFNEYSRSNTELEKQVNEVNNKRMVLKRMAVSNLNSHPNKRATSKKEE